MSNENQETIADIVSEMRGPYYKMGRSNASLDKDMMGYMSFIANRIEAAHKREREAGAEAAQICGEIGEMVDEKRISDAVIKSLRDRKLEMEREIVAKDAEVSTLRALVGEMADALDTTIHYRDFICDCGEPSLHNCSVRSRVCFAKNRLLVMKARDVVKAKGGER